MKRTAIHASLLVGLLALSSGAQAAIISSTLGNDAPGFNDGDTPAAFTVGGAQSGQPAPFDTSYGNDVIGPDFAQSWTHSFGAIADPIVSASLTIGIWDHDSAASGSQLDLFSVDGNVLTTDLDALFEAGGGSTDLEYNVYTIDLAGLFGDLADGSVTIELNLDGPGLVTPLFPLPGPNPPEESSFNGASLVYSSLMIETRNGQPVPGPGPLPLALLAFGTLLWRRRDYALAAVRKR
jgi:uncharacterized protein (TIGR03382 family)